MPADNTLNQTPSAMHGNGDTPYPCHAQKNPPGPRDALWAIDYGYCRTSLDYHPPGYGQGSDDPRCPVDCQHKAPGDIAQGFGQVFETSGAMKAAEWARETKALG